MIYAALLVALAALFVAWRAGRAVKDLKERNARLSSQLYDLRVELHQAAEAQRRAIAQLRYDVMRQAGSLQVRGDMSVDQVTRLHPQAAALLAGFHIGGCASCAVDGATRLEEAVAANGSQLEPVLVALNSLVADGAASLLPEDQLRPPNVELRF
jgi:F0F1-type ATP synthase membrane subunit c/vacuolar-type H+-ATPase subunit K